MSGKVKYIKLKRSDNYGFGFSILGGAGSELPPLVYDVIEGSPASKSNQLSPGDIILEINGQDVLTYTTKEVLNCLRLSAREVILKLKTDNSLKEKVNHLRKTPNNSEILRTAITQDDLQGVKQILAKKSEASPEDLVESPPSSPVSKGDSLNDSNSSSEEDGFKRGAVENDWHQQKKPKSETDFVSGDLILNLSRTSHDPNLPPPQKAVNNVKKSTSMPTSPNDKEKGLDGMNKMDKQGMGSPQSLCSPASAENDACGSFIYPPSTALVRISKSEDYLQHQKDNLSSVNIELEDDVTSSLNTLLDTRDDLPTGSSVIPINSCALSNCINKDDLEPHTVWTINAPLTSSSPPDSSGHSSHDSDSPLIPSLSPVSPQSPTSSMQYSCSGIYNKMCSARDSLGSSNRSENVCSNSSSLTSPDTDVPDELEWDDTTPTFSPTNQIINGYSNPDQHTMNGHSGRNCASPTDSSISENLVQKLDENRIIIKVAGPEKVKKKKHSSHRKHSSHDKGSSLNGDPDRTPTNTPPQTPGSGTLSPETLAYQQLWESEDEITCLSEKSDESSGASKPTGQRGPCATSPPLSEDESDIESLHSFHYSPKAVDIPSAVRLAKRLFALDGFKKSDVSRHLSKNNEFSRAVAEEYLRYFDLRRDTLDIALRKFLDKFCLSGETQERERVLVHFSKRYLDCNPGTFNSQDAVHTLTCALMLLNTDLHSQNIGRKMTASEFIDNLAELNDGENFDASILKNLYEAIRKEPLKWATDEDDDEGKLGKGLLEEGHGVIGSNPFLTTPIGSGVVYKKGYIMRKCCVEPSGKRTAFGKRSWKMWFCVIQDLILYLHKDEQGARRGPPPQMGQNAVRLHHALAQKAFDYSKKEHVFRLQTADQAEYLLQTSDSKELQAWIDAINFVAASLSAPPMPGAVGSQRKFQRPLLPCSITKLNVVEQLEDHTARLNQLESDLNHLKTNPPDKAAKSTTVAGYKEKEVYLTAEVKRYQTYVYLLRSRLEAAGGSAIIGGAVCGLGINELPVFEVNTEGVQVKEVGPEEVGDPAGIVPPPIPERPRHSDSEEKAVENTIDAELKAEEKAIQTAEKKENFLEKIIPKKDDEFKKELDKMIKEKEKRDKKKEKQEKKQYESTLKREKKERERINKTNKTNEKEVVLTKEVTPSKLEENIKENENSNGTLRQKNSDTTEDPRVGTLGRLTAIFKFNKLNRGRRNSFCSEDEQIELLKNDCSYTRKESSDKPDSDIISFPSDEDIKPEVPDKSFAPPPLPPKPGALSPIRKNLGTRVINV